MDRKPVAIDYGRHYSDCAKVKGADPIWRALCLIWLGHRQQEAPVSLAAGAGSISGLRLWPGMVLNINKTRTVPRCGDKITAYVYEVYMALLLGQGTSEVGHQSALSE